MAYINTPRSWTTAELVTATFMNGIRDALNECAPALLTTTGDLLYASSSTVRARLAIGSSGESLIVSGGVPAWGDPTPVGMYAHAYASSSQTISDNTQTNVTLDTLVQAGGFTLASNALTVPTTGLYVIGWLMQWGADATAGVGEIRMRVNDAAITGLTAAYATLVSGVAQSSAVSKPKVLTAGDTLKLYALQITGGNRGLGGGDIYSGLFAHYLGK